MPTPRTKAFLPVAAALGVASVAALYAVGWLGRIHPDELFQMLEPALWRARGYGVLAWEWQVGLRNWALPYALSVLLRGCDAVGIENPRVYRAVLEVPQWLLHGWMLWSAYRYAARRAPGWGGAVALLGVGLYGVVVAFGGRTMSESISTAFFVIGVEALDRTERPWRAGLLGGAALGLAVVARYGSAVLVLAAMCWLLGAQVVEWALRRGGIGSHTWKRFLAAAVSGLSVAALLGYVDLVTWGHWFHSFRQYVQFNVISGGAAAQFGRQPGWYYVPWLLAAPLWVWPGLFFAVRSERRLSLPLWCAALYLVAVSLTPHKEARFLYPALVLLAVGAAPGLALALARVSNARLKWGLAIALLVVGMVLALPNEVTPFIPGDLQVKRPDQFRATARITRGADVTGFLLVDEGMWGSGGFFYIGRNVPWLPCGGPEDPSFRFGVQETRINRAITWDGRGLNELASAGFHVIGHMGHETLLAR